MSHTNVNPQIDSRIQHIAGLVIGDTLIFLLFIMIGRDNHNMSVGDISAVLFSLAPFLLGWFIVTPWFGLFQLEVCRTWRKLLPRLLIAWLILGGPLALVFWALFRGRPVPGGIIPVFAVITLAVTTIFLLIWRLGYAWWLNRIERR